MMLTVVLVALMVRELGGGLATQTAAALLWGPSPYGLAGGSLFHSTFLDVLCWVALIYVVLVGLNRERPRLWLVAGVIAGIGLDWLLLVPLLALHAAALLFALPIAVPTSLCACRQTARVGTSGPFTWDAASGFAVQERHRSPSCDPR